MFKAVLATALLASTTLAYEFVEAYTNELLPRSLIHIHDILVADYSYNFEVGYNGYYKTDPDPTTRRIKDAIGFRIFSNVKANFRVELFSHIKAEVEFSFTPFEVTPLGM